jgi:hypothetical protein
LDANVLFSAAYLPNSDLAQLWTLPDIELISSQFAKLEAERNLPPEKQADLSRLIGALAGLMGDVPDRDPPVALPDKDKPILLAAILAGATHLLTGDIRHFGPYFGQRVEGVLILPPAQYLELRRHSG